MRLPVRSLFCVRKYKMSAEKFSGKSLTLYGKNDKSHSFGFSFHDLIIEAPAFFARLVSVAMECFRVVDADNSWANLPLAEGFQKRRTFQFMVAVVQERLSFAEDGAAGNLLGLFFLLASS